MNVVNAVNKAAVLNNKFWAVLYGYLESDGQFYGRLLANIEVNIDQ